MELKQYNLAFKTGIGTSWVCQYSIGLETKVKTNRGGQRSIGLKTGVGASWVGRHSNKLGTGVVALEMLENPAIVNNFGEVKGAYCNCKSFYWVRSFWSKEFKKKKEGLFFWLKNFWSEDIDWSVWVYLRAPTPNVSLC